MILSGLVQLLVWAIPKGSLPAAYVFALLYGAFGGGYIGLMPLVLAHIFDRNKLCVYFCSWWHLETHNGPSGLL